MAHSSAHDTIAVITITGKKNSGKTTLIENLIPRMLKREWEVCTIKHHHFGDFEPDVSGKDSHRHYEAGAQGVILASPFKMAYFERHNGRVPEVHYMLQFFPKTTNLVLIEGFHKSVYPHIEVSRRENSTELLSDSATPLIAVAADYSPEVQVPVFELDAYNELADFLDHFLRTGFNDVMK